MPKPKSDKRTVELDGFDIEFVVFAFDALIDQAVAMKHNLKGEELHEHDVYIGELQETRAIFEKADKDESPLS